MAQFCLYHRKKLPLTIALVALSQVCSGFEVRGDTGCGLVMPPARLATSMATASTGAPSVASEAARAAGLFHATPLVRSSPLSDLAGCPVYLKLDILQPSGSFKDRGMAHLVREAASCG